MSVRLTSGACFCASRRSRTGFDWFGLRNIEISIGHVVEKVGETAQHHTGDDLDNFRTAKTSISYGRELLVTDLSPAFQHIACERQCRFRTAVPRVAGATGENVVSSQSR